MNVDSKVAKSTLDSLDNVIYNHKKMVLSIIYAMYIKDIESTDSPQDFYNKYLH